MVKDKSIINMKVIKEKEKVIVSNDLSRKISNKKYSLQFLPTCFDDIKNQKTIDYKGQKLKTSNIIDIVNGLIQKYYFKKVKDLLSLSSHDFRINFGSSSNNGEGLIQIDFLKHDYKYQQIDFQIGYQIQGSVVKINTSSKDYENSKSNELHPDIKNHFAKLKKLVEFNRINPPQTKAYYSVSKPLPKNIYDYSPQELAVYIQNEITNIEDHVKQLWDDLK
jgi:hypothetical protein